MAMTDTIPGNAGTTAASTRTVDIEFLYIDLDTCRRCGGTDKSLDEAIALARPTLAAAGIGLTLTKTLIETSAQAAEYQLMSSPTIRIGGVDIAGELVESNCGDCGALSACGDSTDCRVWQYRGAEYSAAPTGLVVEAVMAAAVGVTPEAEPYPGLPENLERFFDGSTSAVNDESDCGCGSDCS